MANPLLKRLTVLAAKIETTAYTAETLLAANTNFNVFDASMTVNIDQREREANDGFSNRASTAGLRSATCSFKVDLTGDGAGQAPGWFTTFMPACALVEVSSDTYEPQSSPPGVANVKTISLALYENGRRKFMRGCMGNAKLMFPTGKDAYVEFTFQGSWGGVTDAALLVPTYPTQLPLRSANSDITIGSDEPCLQEIMVDLGNVVVMRECQTASDASGYLGALVTNRKVGGTLDPEASLIADYDPFGDWLASTERALTIVLADAVDTFTITVPKFQLSNVGEGDRNGIRTDPLTWQANREAVGDDEITIAFSATA